MLAGLALALGMLAWVLSESLRGTGGPPQFVSLPDGTKYRFGGATWGTDRVPPFMVERVAAHLPKSLFDHINQKFGKRLGLVPFSNLPHNGPPELQVWMNQIASPPGGLFPVTPAHGFLADENGVEAGTPYGYINGYYPWESAVFTVVPRRSRMLEVHFYTNDVNSNPALSKAGSVRFRNPLYGNYPQWKPEPLPATRMAGDFQLTLKSCRVGDRWQGKFATSFGMELTQPTNTNEHWQVQRIEVSDATGNSISTEFYVLNNGRECSVPALFWPDEKALRLRVWLKRTAGFSSNELTCVTNLPVPLTNATNGVTITTKVGGHTVRVRNYVKPENKVGGGIQFYTGPVPAPLAISMVLDDPSSDLLAEIQGVKTDFGVPMQDHQGWGHTNGEERRYNSFPPDTHFLSVSVSVQKMQVVEFLVKPPNAN